MGFKRFFRDKLQNLGQAEVWSVPDRDDRVTTASHGDSVCIHDRLQVDGFIRFIAPACGKAAPYSYDIA